MCFPAMLRDARRIFVPAAAIIVALCFPAGAMPPGFADAQGPSTAGLNSTSGAANVTERVRVMDFGHLAGPTTIAFRYTPLVPGAAGQAEIEPFKSVLKIHAVFSNLPAASRLGSEYLTYTLWQVTSDGRTTNLGEVERTGSAGEIRTKSRSLRFGLIVTAEAYFAVSQPSAAVAFESDLAPGGAVNIPLTQVNCELLRKPIGAQSVPTVAADPKVAGEPLLFEEARLALAVARAAGAARYAPETLDTAEQTLQIAGNLLAQGAKKADVHDAALEAVLIAEDARVLAVARQKRAQITPSVQDPAP